MTAWTTINEEQIDQDSPVNYPLLAALRDNPLSIAVGGTGAPRIVNNAVANGELGAEKFQIGPEERDWIQGRLAGMVGGSVGSLAFLGAATSAGETTNYTIGFDVDGANLEYAGTAGFSGAPLTGTTWRCLGHLVLPENSSGATLFIRIS